MAFRTYSFRSHGINQSPDEFNDEDTYITVITENEFQQQGYAWVKEHFNVIYEGPWAYNHFHYGRGKPSQKIIIFETKATCPPKQKNVPAALLMGKTPAETTL